MLTDPTTIVIVPSTTPGVTHYLVMFTPVGDSLPNLSYNAGNPPPDAEGLLNVAMSDARQGSTEPGPFTLTVTAFAGDLESAPSDPTEPFTFTPPPEPEPPDAPEVTLEGGTETEARDEDR